LFGVSEAWRVLAAREGGHGSYDSDTMDRMSEVIEQVR
jgi:hypothetical protein